VPARRQAVPHVDGYGANSLIRRLPEITPKSVRRDPFSPAPYKSLLSGTDMALQQSWRLIPTSIDIDPL
jgi:hypothetical protein